MSRLREERLYAILDLVEKEGSVRTADLSRIFQVSEMTIHRDLEELAARGLVRKVRGGAVATRHGERPDFCVMCHSPVPEHTRVVLHLKSGERRYACCPHCSIAYMAHRGEEVGLMLVRDLLHQYVVDARVAFYVLDPNVVICCRPAVLAFKSREDAESFQRGFGGKVVDFDGALNFLLGEHH